MDIQGYILDHWLAKMRPEHPILTVYDKEGRYYEILNNAREKGIKVIDTTNGVLHARLAASRFWCDELSLDKSARMIIYRKAVRPGNNRSWVEEPYSCFSKSQPLFPDGAQDDYGHLCRAFLPQKQRELEQLFENGSPSFNLINALLDGAAYPELENLTGGKTIAEIAVGLLSTSVCEDMKWMTEWKKYAEVQYPGLDANGITLKDVQNKLWTYLLFSEFVFDLPEALPDNLKSVAVAPIEMKEKVYLICDKLRNQINLRETYVRMANRVAEQLSLSSVFAKAEHLGERVTFSFENGVEYNRFIDCIKNGNLNGAEKILGKNRQDVWCQENKDVEVFWNLAEQMCNLSRCIRHGVNSDGSATDLITWYAESGYQADSAFRMYYSELSDAVRRPSQVTELTELMNGCYREYTERGVRAYQQKRKEGGSLQVLKNQGYVQKVYPSLKAGKRVVFVMVDAFRYEMGKVFADSIERSYHDRVLCEPRISYLPSVTRFGMAHHLSDIELVADPNGKLVPKIGESLIITPEDRIAYLKSNSGVEVQDVRLEDFDAAAVNDSTQLLVVRSLGIDSAGENEKLNGLMSMKHEMIKLARLIDECKRLGFDEAVLVADHGFMLQPSFRSGDQINKPVGCDVLLDESRLLVGSLNDSENTLSFSPEELGVVIPSMKMIFAKGFSVFKKGEVYFHEGLSLQENVVPIITIKLQEEKRHQSFTVSLSYKGATSGTIYTRRPIIDITVFSELFADDVNLKIHITGDDNNVIAVPDGKFYNGVTELVDIPSGVATIRLPISIDDDYSGGSITISACDPETNVTLSKLKLDFEND